MFTRVLGLENIIWEMPVDAKNHEHIAEQLGVPKSRLVQNAADMSLADRLEVRAVFYGEIHDRFARKYRKLFPSAKIVYAAHGFCANLFARARDVDACFVDGPDSLAMLPADYRERVAAIPVGTIRRDAISTEDTQRAARAVFSAACTTRICMVTSFPKPTFYRSRLEYWSPIVRDVLDAMDGAEVAILPHLGLTETCELHTVLAPHERAHWCGMAEREGKFDTMDMIQVCDYVLLEDTSTVSYCIRAGERKPILLWNKSFARRVPLYAGNRYGFIVKDTDELLKALRDGTPRCTEEEERATLYDSSAEDIRKVIETLCES